MTDNVVYERSVSECVKIGYLQQQNTKHFLTLHPTPLGSPPTSIQNRGYATVVLCTQNEKSAPLHAAVCLLLGSFCDHCKNVW